VRKRGARLELAVATGLVAAWLADALRYGWAATKAALGEIDSSPVVRGDRVYVGNTTGQLWAVDPATGNGLYPRNTGINGNFKGFPFPSGPGVFQYALSNGSNTNPVDLETSPVVIGAPSLDLGVSPNMLLVGSDAGVTYAVEVPF
jgi:hypothetical protein